MIWTMCQDVSGNFFTSFLYPPLYYICWLLTMISRYASWNWATHIFLESSTKGGGSPKTRFFCFTLHEARKKTKTLFKRRGVLATYWMFVAIPQFFRLLKNFGDNKNHGNKKNQFFFGFRFFITEMLPFHELMHI